MDIPKLIIRLKANDGKVFEAPEEVLQCSGLIKKMLEDCGIKENAIIPLENVSSTILRKVLEWAEHHKEDKEPVEDDESKEKRTDDIPPWDVNFLKVDQGTLFELILAANFLNIQGLLDVACKTVANMIKGKSPDEIRKTFNIQNDFPGTAEQNFKMEQ